MELKEARPDLVKKMGICGKCNTPMLLLDLIPHKCNKNENFNPEKIKRKILEYPDPGRY